MFKLQHSRPMKKSRFSLEEIEDVLYGEGPVPVHEIRMRSGLPEIWTGTNGGRFFVGVCCYGTCPFGDCQLVYEIYEDSGVFEFERPDYVYVLTADGYDVNVAGRMFE